MAIAIGLLKMLLELQQTRKTGALDVVGPSARVRLFAESGKIVFADEGTVGETLGRILVRERVLTSEQYAAAIEHMSDLRTAGKRARLGEVFVALGLLTDEQVFAALSAQVQQKVMRALAWPSATFRFVESHGSLDIADRFVTPIEPLVIAVLRLADRERIDALLAQARPRYAALRGDAAHGGGSTKLESIARVNAFRLPAAEDSFARSLDGARTVEELLAEADPANAPPVDRAVVLAALLLMEALDLPRTATAVRPMGGPRPLARGGPVKATANASARLAELDAPPPAKKPLLAEKAYQTGKKLVRSHRLAEAVVALREAASLYKAVEYELWATWAEARADARGDATHVDALRAVAELAIEQDTERGFATFVLGHLAKRAGDDARAAELFARARALDPEVATIDAWDVRLRMGAASPASTRGQVTALAPLMTGDVERAKADAEADAEASAEADEQEGADAGEGERARQVAADARLGVELEARAVRAMPVRDEPRRANEGERATEPATPSRGWLWPASLIGLAVAGAIAVATRTPPHEAAPVVTAATATAAVTATAGAADSAVVAPVANVETPAATAPVADASYAEPDAGLPSVDATKGVLVLPSSADGHRVYVDGRVAGVPPPPIVVGCGRHAIKIGSQGREQVVSVPCGGSLPLAYP